MSGRVAARNECACIACSASRLLNCIGAARLRRAPRVMSWILKALAGARGDGVRSPWSPASASVPALLLALQRCDEVRQPARAPMASIGEGLDDGSRRRPLGKLSRAFGGVVEVTNAYLVCAASVLQAASTRF